MFSCHRSLTFRPHLKNLDLQEVYYLCISQFQLKIIRENMETVFPPHITLTLFWWMTSMAMWPSRKSATYKQGNLWMAYIQAVKWSTKSCLHVLTNINFIGTTRDLMIRRTRRGFIYSNYLYTNWILKFFTLNFIVRLLWFFLVFTYAKHENNFH